MTSAAARVSSDSVGWGRLGVMLVATAAILAAVGAYPTWRVGRWQALTAGSWAMGLNLALFGLCGLAAAILARTASDRTVGTAFLLASIIRMAVVLIGGQAIIRWQSLPPITFWIWAATTYMVMLLCETWWLKGLMFGGGRDAAGGH